ncbi:hypothetical protein Tco_0590661 [Tanacetum coccineum]
MVHNHYLDEAWKKTEVSDRNSKSSVMLTTRFQSNDDDSKPKHRSNNQTSRSLPVSKSSRVTKTTVPKADHSKSSSSFSDSKQFVCSTCHKCVFSANHDACITKLLKEVNSRAKIQFHKTRNSGFLTGKLYNLAQQGTSINVQKEQSLDLSADQASNLIVKQRLNKKTVKPHTTMSTEVHQAAEIVTTSNELDLLFDPLFDEYFNGEHQVVLKSSAVTTTDASNKRQQQHDSTSSTSTLATVTANGNFDL